MVSRQVQDQQGDLATLVEEAAVGIRVIKSFGRRRVRAPAGYDTASRSCDDTSMDKVRLSATFWTLLDVVPNMTLAVVLLVGGPRASAAATSPSARSSRSCTLMLSAGLADRSRSARSSPWRRRR